VSEAVLVTVIDRAAGFEASFEVAPGETVLEAALRADVELPYSCRSGTCRTCLSRVVSGRIEHDSSYADELLIDEDEVAEGFRLLCSSLAHTNGVIDVG
jgi:ferredoxin